MWIEDNFGANIQDWKTEYWTGICKTTNAAKGFKGYDIEEKEAASKLYAGIIGVVTLYFVI